MGDVIPFDRGEDVAVEEARETVARLRQDLADSPGSSTVLVSARDLEVALLYVDYLDQADSDDPDDDPDGPGDGERMAA